MRAVKDGGEIRIEDGYLHRESIKEIDGRRYDADGKAWFVPCNEKNSALLQMLGAELDEALCAFVKPVCGLAVNEEIPVCEMPLSVKPYQHQVRGFNCCMQNDGYGLLFDVGLGKSLTAIAVAGARYKKGEIKRLLIVCPLAVQSVWERECGNLTVENHVQILEGSTAKRCALLKRYTSGKLQIAVINYEGVRIMPDELIEWQPDMIIADESQRIKNPQSKQAKSVHKIAARCKYRIILTATPIGNSVIDVFSQWKVIDENIFGKSFYSFKNRYLIMGGYGQYKVVAYKNMSELLEKAHSKALRITKKRHLIYLRRYLRIVTAN